MAGAVQTLACAVRYPIFIGLILALPLATAQEQPTAIWHGSIRNSAGAPIAGATVRLAGSQTGESATGADGTFTLSALPPGQYKLTVATAERTVSYAAAIELRPAAPAVVVTLSDRGEITVAAQAETSATGGEALTGQAVSSLPLNGRDFSTLLLLAAGTMTDANGATNFTQQFAINGQRGVGGHLRHGWRRHHRSRDGRKHLHQLQCGRDSGSPIQFRLDAGGNRPGRIGIHQHRHPVRRQRVSRLLL